ncbi:hypothetical protein D3C71_945550 [compost metagenome]
MLRQLFARGLLGPGDRLAERIARGQAGGDGDRAQPVEAVEVARLGHFTEGDQVGQRHQLAVAGAHADGGQVGGRGAPVATGLDQHVVLLAVVDEGGDAARAHHGFQRAADGGDRHAQVGRTLAIDVDPHLRPGFLVVRVGADQAGIVGHALQHAVAPLRDLGIFGPAQHDLERLALAAHQATTDLGAHAHPAHAVQVLLQRGGDIRRGVLTLAPRRQEHADPPGMHFLAGAKAARHARVGTHDRLVLANESGHHLLHFLHLGHGVVVAGALGAIDHDLERATVLGRRQLGGQQLEQRRAGQQRQQHDHHVDPGPPHVRLEHAPVRGRDAIQVAVDQAVQAFGRLPAVRLEQLGGHHRGERERDERRQRHRGGQGDGQLAEQAAGIAFQEAHRQEHRNQHRSGGDDREGHLCGAALGGHQRRLTQVDAALHVFHHHDGVIDHQADTQHQRQQGEQVDRETERVQRDERGHQAHRHGHGGNQRGAETAQEQPDHHQHQQHGLHQRGVDAVHRRLDEGGVVEGDENVGAFRQGLPDPLGFSARGAGHVQRVGGGGLDDAQANAGLAVAAVVGAPFGRGQLDPGHVAHAHHVAVGALAQRDGGEIFRLHVVALHAQGEVAVGGFDAAGGELDVLVAQRGFDIADGQATRGKLVAIQPDAHGIALAAADTHLGHAIQAGEAVHDIAVGVVAQLQRIHAGGGHVEPDDGVGVALDLGDFRRPRLLGHAVGDAADRITHIVGGRFDIAVGGELDADLGAAVGAARIDGVDAFDAGQGVFKHLGDPAFNHRGRCAGVIHRDRDDRRIDGRQFAQGEPGEGHDAQHDEQQAHHHGKHRALDGDVGELHPAVSAGALAAGTGAGRSSTFKPGRSLPVPSTTMRSPDVRPLRISTTPARRAPLVMSMRSTL